MGDGADDLLGENHIEFFGSDVALSADGNTLAVGAVGHNFRQGRVRVFFNGSEFGNNVQVGNDILGEEQSNSWGTAVDLNADGTILAAGAYTNDGINGEDSGHVRVFQLQGDEWVQLGQDIDGEAANDWFGLSVALSSDGLTVAAGSRDNGDGGVEAGHVRVFSYDGTRWNQVGADIDGVVAEGWLGDAVDISGSGKRIVTGAPQVGANEGAVYVYEFDSVDGWTLVGNPIMGSDFNGWFGRSVSMSRDGNVIAVGTWSDKAEIYFLNEFDEWTQVGPTLLGNSATEVFGSDVAISGDASRVIVGGPGERGDSTFPGVVRVFELSESCQSAIMEATDAPSPTTQTVAPMSSQPVFPGSPTMSPVVSAPIAAPVLTSPTVNDGEATVVCLPLCSLVLLERVLPFSSFFHWCISLFARTNSNSSHRRNPTIPDPMWSPSK